jgi:heptaprenyl diphosphate synthase
VVTLVALLSWGWQVAVWISMLRVLVGSLLIGTFLTPTFVLSFSGACCSLLGLALVYAFSRRFPGLAAGPVGFGVVSALLHMLGQFWAAYWLFIPHKALFHLLPVLMTMALIFGMVSGIIASRVVTSLNTNTESLSNILK